MPDFVSIMSPVIFFHVFGEGNVEFRKSGVYEPHDQNEGFCYQKRGRGAF